MAQARHCAPPARGHKNRLHALPETASTHAKHRFRHAEKFCRAVADKGLKDRGLQAAFGLRRIEASSRLAALARFVIRAGRPGFELGVDCATFALAWKLLGFTQM